MVPQTPVCTYAHVREDGHAFAERVKKRTGTNWDRDQLGGANSAGLKFVEGSTKPPQEKRTVGLLLPFVPYLKQDLPYDPTVNLCRTKSAVASLALAVLNRHQEAA